MAIKYQQYHIPKNPSKPQKYADMAYDWDKCVERAVIDMKNDIAAVLK